jgi:phosphoribosylglycinamide formyltransferase-1
MGRTLCIAVLASGEGTTFEALVGDLAERAIAARIVLLVTDRSAAPVRSRADRLQVPVLVLPPRGVDPAKWSDACTMALKAEGVDLIVLAGYLAILPPRFLAQWAGRVVNLHPALLPRHGGRGMYGIRVHGAVLAAGDTETGVSVHLVTEAVDAGPVLWQERIEVEPGDTPERLRERVRPLERVALSEVIARFADGRWPLPSRGPGLAWTRADA